ncbi:MAG: class I SAM-dependent methyltransferase [Planctomycetota bacterium]|nr:MAG: class I SAM-dependent methyltransferase [Planctomycetota bacterium]REJ93698.1 MAG: class I SAM-dependent methyltransferase [Planctomycetota bacterium]REK25746.1 MAG: class I SAM-dependent methyltransferase [Planctomycetota bacterium]REK46507.1 MAG: class I SAM-dependent methyltransferase [Planctomycetota bacterium]
MLLKRVLEPEIMDSSDEAEAYDAMDHGEVNRRFVDDLLAAVSERVSRLPERTAEGAGTTYLDFLDLGTGTAQIPVELVQRNPAFRCLAVDLAPSMLEFARLNLEFAHVTDRVVLELVDAKRLPYESGRFPIVFSNSLVHHLPDPQPAIAEAARVTEPGGTLFFRDLLRPPDDAAVKRLVQQYAGDETQQQQQLLDDSLRAALSLAEIREIVVGCGFAATTVRTSSDRHWTWIGIKS